MIAVLLCAGFGTRLYPLTRREPKPLLPVAGRPLLDYLMESLSALPDLEAIHLVTNARHHAAFRQWGLRWHARLSGADIPLEIHNDGAAGNESRLGACADLALALERASGWDGALVSAGDNIYRFSIKSLWSRFRQQPAHHVTVLPEADPEKRRRSGVALLGADDRLLKLQEKPLQPLSEWICIPLYFLRPAAEPVLLELLRESSHPPDAPGHFIARLCLRQPVYAFKPRGSRLDIGTPSDYRHAQRRIRRARGH